MRPIRTLAPLLGAALLAMPALAQQKTNPPRTPPRAPEAKAAARDSAGKAAPKPAPSADVPKYAYLQGVAYDSIHGEPLIGALIQVEGTQRLGPTDSLGRFLIDSIVPGSYRLIVDHPVLDTLGITLVTDTMKFVVNQVTRTMVAVPDGVRLVNLFCPAAKRAFGPGALVGRVREPDTDEPAVGARVSIVWYDPDPPGIPQGMKVKRPPKVRETVVQADGTYRICGLPDVFEGKLQAQRKDGGATAEVTISQTEGTLSLRSMSVAAMPKGVIASKDTGAVPVAAPVKGTARVFGRVVTATGAPVSGARVDLMGYSATTRTRADGSFVLDSLPSGTQAVVVRQLGYAPTEATVELSARTPARVNVKLPVFVPTLAEVEVVSRREAGLQKVGFTDRKRTGVGGHFLDPDQIEKRKAQRFSDLLTTMPGIRVSYQNNQAILSATRTATGDGGCVTLWVDGAKWQQLEAGDLDGFLQPTEVAAIEVYTGTAIPAQFVTAGQNCAAIVVWTKTRVDTRRK